MPELMAENDEAAMVYALVKNQVIYAQHVPVDLKFEAIQFVFDLYEIDDRQAVFERVLKAWHEINRMDQIKMKR